MGAIPNEDLGTISGYCTAGVGEGMGECAALWPLIPMRRFRWMDDWCDGWMSGAQRELCSVTCYIQFMLCTKYILFKLQRCECGTAELLLSPSLSFSGFSLSLPFSTCALEGTVCSTVTTVTSRCICKIPSLEVSSASSQL